MKYQTVKMTKAQASEILGDPFSVWLFMYGSYKAFLFTNVDEDGKEFTDYEAVLNILNPVGFIMLILWIVCDIIWTLPVYGISGFMEEAYPTFFGLRIHPDINHETIKFIQIDEKAT